NTDASLLLSVSWPALVINEDEVRVKTIEKVIRKLKGNFGIKHFPKDRDKTVQMFFFVLKKTETATQSALNSQEYSKLPGPFIC
ncbi:phosphorylase b kinase regulatory subunit beta, partial [Biomphalaria pfeifferi]